VNRPNRRTYDFIVKHLNDLGLRHPQVCEVGVGLPQNSVGLKLWQDEVAGDLLLVEPNPHFIPAIRQILDEKKWDSVRLKPVAVVDSDESSITLMLPRSSNVEDSQGAHVKGVKGSAPALRAEWEYDEVQVESERWDCIDPGNIDVLLLDMEGSEWAVIRHLVSRPLIVIVEMQWRACRKHGGWVNPHQQEIHERLLERGYQLAHQGNGDWYYLRTN
jgi:FkbM family methyltransferase